MKIRCWENEGPFKLLESMGAAPVTMPFGDVYNAIQQGTVDGVITGTFQHVPQRFTEVAPYITTVRTQSCYQGLTFSKEWLDSQPADVKQAFLDAGKAAHDYCRDYIVANAETDAYKKMEELGCKVAYLTDEERQVFIDLGKQSWPFFRERLGPELFDRITAFLEDYEKNKK